MEDSLRFEYPFLFWIGLLICIGGGYLLVLANRRRDRDLAKLVNAKLMPGVTDSISIKRRLIRQGIWLVALFLLFIAWARPQWGFEEREVKRRGIDLVFAIDTSQSMMAEDIVPNRLERAKIAITDFVERLEGDRVALIPFAGKAFSLCPLTLDYGAFYQSLDAIDTSIIPHLGTDISTAVAEANRLFDEQKNSLRILILITDGEDLQGDVPKALAEAQKKDMKIFTVGVGSAEGAMIPAIRNGYRDFVRDQNGQPVITSLDAATLEKVATETGGIYAPLGQSGQGLNQIYQENLSLVPRQDIDQKLERVPIERYEWFLAIAILLLLIEFIFTERRGRIPWLEKLDVRKYLPQSAAILISLSIVNAQDQDARETYNKGTKAYQEGNYEEANRILQQSLKETSDLALQQKAYYNMGNARFRIAQKTLETNPNKETIEKLKQSIKAYDGALELDPNDADAAYNRDFVQKVLDELENQDQEDQDQQDQDQQDQDQQDQDQQDQDQQDQDQQDQDQQDQDQQDQDQQDQDQQEQDQQEQDQQEQDQQEQDQQEQDQQEQDQQDQDQQDQDQQDQDQQEQDQQEQDQQEQDQQNQDQQDQDQQDQDQQSQDQQSQDQQSQDQQEQDPSQANNIDEERRAKPEQMTEEQANQLLESLKNDERTVVPLPDMQQYRQSVPNNTTKGKTW